MARISKMNLRRFVKAVRWFSARPLRRRAYLTQSACRQLAAGMHWTTEFDGGGNLDCTKSVILGRRTHLSVPRKGHLILRRGVWLGDDCEIGVTGVVSIGAHTSLQNRSIVLGDVTIGAGCACGANLYISSSWHHFEDTPEYPIRWQDVRASSAAASERRSRAVVVGDDCWIGINVVIAPGVNIGRGCVIGANSVVTRDLPPYSVAAGAPAKVLRKRLNFSPPSSLKANRIEHIPYFYTGFVQWGEDVAGLEQVLDKGGWPTEKMFGIAIKVEKGVGVKLSVRAMGKGALRHGSQMLNVALGESVLCFAAEPEDDGLLAFKWSPFDGYADDASTLVVLAVDQK